MLRTWKSDCLAVAFKIIIVILVHDEFQFSQPTAYSAELDR
jgi:hypothetical protein